MEAKTNQTAETPEFFSTDYLLMHSAAVFCVLITIFGNLLVLVSFKLEKKLRTVSNYYVFSLALADLGVG